MRSLARGSAAPRRTTSSTVPGRVLPTRGPQLPRALGNRTTARLLADRDAQAVPPVVHRVLSAPGEPLDLTTRRVMEPHFGHDFSGVRVHHGPSAAASAATVHALAYTVGSHIVFGAGQYLPGTEQGRSLLAHELTHVVQQRNVGTGPIQLGSQSDDAERRADAVDSQPTLRRAVTPVKTWAGTFTADPYNPTDIEAAGRLVGHGAKITITFEPGPLVDAEQISFVQAARSVKDGKPHNRYDADENTRKTAESRMLPGGTPAEGTHIDQAPKSRTPLFPDSHVGWRYRDSNNALRIENASMTDTADLDSVDVYHSAEDVQAGEWSQQFETTALATAGSQRGTYYGSVRWGWSKPDKGKPADLRKFEVVSKDVPSPTFMAAGRLWSSVRTSDKAQPDEVPVAERRTVAAKDTQLWESPAKRFKVATLPKGTVLEHREIRPRGVMPSLSWFWAEVTVINGRYAGKTGWMWAPDLSPRKP